MTTEKPTGLFMVTDTGMRIPIDLKLADYQEDSTTFWEPVIEADLNAVMPHVVAFDGPPLGAGRALHFPEPGPGWDTMEWVQRIMDNSRHVISWYDTAGVR